MVNLIYTAGNITLSPQTVIPYGQIETEIGPILDREFAAREEPDFLAANYGPGFADAFGTFLLGATANGGVAYGHETQESLIHELYAFALKTSTQTLETIDSLGVSSNARLTAYVNGGQTVIWDGTTAWQVTNESGNPFVHAEISHGLFKAFRSDGTHIETGVNGLTSDIGVGVTNILFLPGYGQSNSTGNASGSVLTTTTPRAGRTLMFNGGIRVSGYDQIKDRFEPIPDLHYRDIVNAKESLYGSTGETFMSAALHKMTDSGFVSSEVAALGAQLGLGSASIEYLSGPSNRPWDNLMKGLRRARLLSAMRGYRFEVPALLWDQGEANINDSAGVYLAKLQSLQAQFEAQVLNLNAAPSDNHVPLVYSQTTTFVHYSALASGVPQDQLDACLNNPDKFICIGPKYQYSYAADNVHLLADSQHQMGALMAHALSTKRAGTTWKPMHAISAVRTGSSVALRIYVPVGDLVTDTTTVSDPGNFGLAWEDDGDGNTVTISSAVVGNNTNANARIDISLSDVPTGSNPRITIAMNGSNGDPPGRTSGARACFRDSATAQDSRGNTLYSWICHQKINVTT